MFGRSRRSKTDGGRSRPPVARDRDGHETAGNCSISTRRTGSRSVQVQTSGRAFVHGSPATVLETAYAGPVENTHPYDVSADGQRFLMIKEDATAAAARTGLTVVLNWFEELKTKVP